MYEWELVDFDTGEIQISSGRPTLLNVARSLVWQFTKHPREGHNIKITITRMNRDNP